MVILKDNDGHYAILKHLAFPDKIKFWARWGATKWVQNEPRAAADNTYDPDVPLPPSCVRQISFQNFFNVIRPSFTEQASKAHMDAVFKRFAFLVNSKDHLYFRKAGINTDPVGRVAMPLAE